MEQMQRMEQARVAPLLPDTNLHRRYTVRKVAEQMEVEAVYLGFDYVARQEVTIREFFPKSLAVRAAGSPAISPRFRSLGALFFLSTEAYVHQYDALTKAIGNPNLLSVFDAFFENGTGYAVTERLTGLTLGEYLSLRDRLLTPGEAVYIAQGVSDALLVVHSLSILHHDISLDTIFISTDGTVKLIDFGAGKRTVRTRRKVDDGQPSRDIRDLGAALYQAVTGRTPPDRPAISAEPAYLDTLSDMLDRMLSLDSAMGFQSVFDLRYGAYALDVQPVAPVLTEVEIAAWREEQRHRLMQEEVTADSAPPTQPTPAAREWAGERATVPKPSNRYILWTVCGAILALLTGLAVALWLRFAK